MGTLEGRVAIVTGGGSGIGRAMGIAMAAEGATVILADITGAEEETAAAIGDGATAVHADVTSDDDMRALIKGTVGAHGRLDVMCNNAGIDGEIAPLAECTLENFDRVIAINLRGVFLGMRHAIPAMLENDPPARGSIINTASVAAFVAFRGASPYCAAKAGVLGLTRVGAAEYSAAGVRVNAICPGVIRTSILRHLEEHAPELLNQIIADNEQMTASKRIAEPEEVASVAVFLAGDGASFITGSAVTVDGGWTAI